MAFLCIRPVATGYIREQCPPKLILWPPNFVVLRTILLKQMTKSKLIRPYFVPPPRKHDNPDTGLHCIVSGMVTVEWLYFHYFVQNGQ